jgi:hypothetical protein
MSMVGAACATLAAPTRAASGASDLTKVKSGLPAHFFIRARAARRTKLMVSDVLFAPMNKAPDANFKSKSSFKISSSKCCLKFEDKGFISGSQEVDAKLLQATTSNSWISDWNEKNRFFRNVLSHRGSALSYTRLRRSARFWRARVRDLIEAPYTCFRVARLFGSKSMNHIREMLAYRYVAQVDSRICGVCSGSVPLEGVCKSRTGGGGVESVCLRQGQCDRHYGSIETSQARTGKSKASIVTITSRLESFG